MHPESTQKTASQQRPYVWPFALALTFFVVSGAQKVAAPSIDFSLSIDKIAHFLLFGLLATSILRTPRLKKVRAVDIALAILITSAYGGFDELRQSLTPGRSVEFADWIADTLGAIVAATIYGKWAFYRNLLERPISSKAFLKSIRIY